MAKHELHRWSGRLPESEVNFLIHVLPERRIIFVTNPKVASSTIKSTLWRWHLRNPDYEFGRNEIHNKKKSPFGSPHDFDFREFMSNINCQAYFRMCFVRNPYTRLLAFYLDKIVKRRESLVLENLGFSNDEPVTFSALVARISERTWHDADRHYRAQTENLLWGDILYDFTGRFESFSTEMDRLALSFDFHFRDYLFVRRRHATQAETHLHEFYTCELQERVHDLYRSDFEAFGYDHALPRVTAVVGEVESRPRLEVCGWLRDPSSPGQGRRAAIHIDGRRCEVVPADRPHPDVERRTGSGRRCGFRWKIPDNPGVQDGARIEVFDADTGQSLAGSPMRVVGGRVDCASDVFPTLDTDLDAGPHESPHEDPAPKKRICIATSSIGGPLERESRGTALHHLACVTAGCGHEVTIAYVAGDATDSRLMEQTREYYSGLGISFQPIVPDAVANTELVKVLAPTSSLLGWLRSRDRPFDVVHVSDSQGLGYDPLLAKSLGIALGSTHFVVHGHGPTLWKHEGNGRLLSSQHEFGWVFMERRSVELADTLVCASAAPLRWMRRAGYVLPVRSFVCPEPFPAPDASPAAAFARAGRDGAKVEEVVYYGRLEPRKGLRLFIDAMNRLMHKGGLPAGVTFLGGAAEWIDAPDLIRDAAKAWPTRVRIITDYRAEEALAYLSQPGRLAVLCSPQGNSALAVTECLHAGIPFVATATGETADQVAPEDRARAIVAPDHVSLGDRVAALAGRPAGAVRPRFDLGRSHDAWSRWHAQNAPLRASRARFERKAQRSMSETPPVTVCIVHHERPELVRMAVDSVLAQDYPALEAVLVDDGSTSAEALAALDVVEGEFAERGWRVLREENRHGGAARNRAAGAGRGEWLLFLDDDNVLFADAVSRLVRAARFSRADAVSAAAIRFTGNGDPRTDVSMHGIPIRYLGAARAWNRFRNVAGDTCGLVSREAFTAVGGFPEDYGVWLQDMCLFNRLLEAGYRAEPMPDPVFYYRYSLDSDSGVTRRSRHFADAAAVRVLSPFLAGLSDEDRAFAAYAVNATYPGVHPVLAKELDAARYGLDATRHDLDATRRDLDAARRDLDAARHDLDAARHDIANRERRLGVLSGELEIARAGHAMTLAHRRSRFGNTRLEASLLLNPQLPDPVECRHDGSEPVLDLRCNARTVAHASARDRSGDVVRFEAKTRVFAVGEALYSIHDRDSGEVLAALVSPAPMRARRIVGAVESREQPQVRGWILDPVQPARRRRIAIHVDGRLCKVMCADRPRDDIARWKGTDGRHGFWWQVPDAMAAVDGTRIEAFDSDTGRPLDGSPIHIRDGRAIATGRRGT